MAHDAEAGLESKQALIQSLEEDLLAAQKGAASLGAHHNATKMKKRD